MNRPLRSAVPMTTRWHEGSHVDYNHGDVVGTPSPKGGLDESSDRAFEASRRAF